MTRLSIAALLLATSFLSSQQLRAQHSSTSDRVTIAATYSAGHSNVTDGTSFWMQGGGADVSVGIPHNFSAVANFNGSHTAMAGSSNAPLSLFTFTFGPRYSWPLPHTSKSHRTDLFGQALFGVAHEFDATLPTSATSASSFALQIGGGVNIGIAHAFAVRAIEADWLRTELPNATTGVQNNLRLSTGLVFRFRAEVALLKKVLKKQCFVKGSASAEP